jgi:hypothetical protein
MDNDEVQELVDAAVKALWPVIGNSTKGQPSIATVKAVLAPYLRKSLKTCNPNPPKIGARPKEFLVTGQFYDMARGKDAAVLVGETDEDEPVEGQAAVLDAIAEWIAELHADDEVSEDASPEAIHKKAQTLRTMLSRGNGICTIRVHYEADGVPHLAQVRVKRSET